MSAESVKSYYFDAERKFPLVLEPHVSDLDSVAWAESHSESIFLHNEQSYNLQFPLKIYFFCLVPATKGGETPIADSRRILDAIRPDVRRKFSEHGYTYARNFGKRFGLSWQETFQTHSKAEVEHYCSQHQITCTWLDNDRLRTSQKASRDRQTSPNR